MSQSKLKDETLDEFLKRELERLDQFGDYWYQKSKVSPEDYPRLLPAGDWDEQLAIFGMYKEDELS
jgi:hypothetical protein